MTTLSDLTPHTLTLADSINARRAFHHALDANAYAIKPLLAEFDDKALVEVLWCVEFLAGMVSGTLKDRHAPPVPEGVEGHTIGQRVGAR